MRLVLEDVDEEVFLDIFLSDDDIKRIEDFGGIAKEFGYRNTLINFFIRKEEKCQKKKKK